MLNRYFNIYNDFWIVIILFVFSSSCFFSSFLLFNNILNFLRCLIFVLIFINHFVKYKFREKYLNLIILLFLIFIISSLVNHNFDFGLIFTFINCVGISLYSYDMLKVDKKRFLNCGRILFFLLSFVNLFMLIFGYGFRQDVGVAYILGIRINFSIYVITNILFCIIYNSIYNNKIFSLFSLVSVIIGVLNLFFASVSTGIIGVFILFFIYLSLNLFNIKKSYYLTIIPFALIVLIVFLMNSNIPFLSSIVGLFGKDLTFSNRTYIWSEYVSLIYKSSLLGYGNTDAFIKAFGSYHPAHNEILYILYKGGIFSFLSYLIIVLSSIKKCGYSLRKIDHLKFSFIFSLLIMSITEIQTYYSLYFLILVMIYFCDIGVSKNG